MTATSSSPVIDETCRYLRRYERYLDGVNVKMALGEKLSILLGCPYMSGRDFLVDHVVNDRDDVLRCFPKLLTVAIDFAGNRSDIASLLSGLVRNKCWTQCLRDEADTYSLAAALLYFIEGHCHSTLECEVDVDVRAILNAWLQPAKPWVKFPDLETLCEHIFGAAWCCMTFPTETPLNDLVLRQRPPFLPGLCPAQNAIQSVPLPDLGLAA